MIFATAVCRFQRVVTLLRESRDGKRERSVRDSGRVPKLEGLHEAVGIPRRRILFGTSITPADRKLISVWKITNGRWNTSGGNLLARSVRLAKNRLLAAPAASIGPDIIAAITRISRPSVRPSVRTTQRG